MLVGCFLPRCGGWFGHLQLRLKALTLRRWEVVNIAFSLVSLLVTFISIARYIAEVLTPLSLLFGCILNMTLSAVVLALDIVIYVQRTDRHYSAAGLGLDTALM